MYIILSKTTSKTAVIKDKTEIAGYTNLPIKIVRKQLKLNKRWEVGDFIIITPDYLQAKSNSGGYRQKKRDDEW